MGGIVSKPPDADQVKLAACGQWLPILATIGIAEINLDGHNHPCPKCGGKDRFAAFKDVADNGGVICRKCHSDGGDGFATVMWYLGVGFPEALEAVASAIGMNNSVGNRIQNGKATTKTGYATAKEAIDATDQSLPKHDRVAEYAYEVGEDVIGYVLRYEDAGGKTFRQVSKHGTQWQRRGPPAKWPLYRLSELKCADRIVLVEGEKAVEAARGIGLNATTSAGGSKGAKNTDWTPLAGKTVVVLPDNDEAGEQYADNVTETLRQLEPPAKVLQVNLPELPSKGDIVDWIDLQFGDAAEPDTILARLNQLIDDADYSAYPKPSPMDVVDMVGNFPSESEPIIDGILRRGETCNLIASPKAGKSWLTLGLGLSIATGRQWLGRDVTAGKVLIIDNELRPATIASRLKTVCRNMEIDTERLRGRLHIESLRGRLCDLFRMEQYFEEIKDASYDLIVAGCLLPLPA